MTDKTIKMYKIVNNVKIYIIEYAPDNSDKSQLLRMQKSLPYSIIIILIYKSNSCNLRE